MTDSVGFRQQYKRTGEASAQQAGATKTHDGDPGPSGLASDTNNRVSPRESKTNRKIGPDDSRINND